MQIRVKTYPNYQPHSGIQRRKQILGKYELKN